jgi:hypothetical protein
MKEVAKFWVTHARSGMSGWLVDRAGKAILAPEPGCLVHVQAGASEQTRPFGDGQWFARDRKPKLLQGAKAGVAYEAIRALSRATGDYASAGKELSAIHDEERAKFFVDGPSALKGKVSTDKRAQKLWDAIMKALEDE